jgi:ElaB/YqjD/DUF883 family membrane-anchored ribosome-binding protein
VNAASVEQAKRDAVKARARLDSTLVALQQRLHPKHLATEAWDGVKEKSSDLAEGAMGAVRERPAMVGAALTAAALFFARKPLMRAASRAFGSETDEDDGAITTTIDTDSENYMAAAPTIDAPRRQGATE